MDIKATGEDPYSLHDEATDRFAKWHRNSCRYADNHCENYTGTQAEVPVPRPLTTVMDIRFLDRGMDILQAQLYPVEKLM